MSYRGDLDAMVSQYEQVTDPALMPLDDAIAFTEDLIEELKGRLVLLREDRRRAQP